MLNATEPSSDFFDIQGAKRLALPAMRQNPFPSWSTSEPPCQKNPSQFAGNIGSHDPTPFYPDMRLARHGAGHGPQCDKTGCTALMLACRMGHTDNVLLLLDRGANPDAQNWQGKKTMDIAHANNQESTVSAIRSWLARKEALCAMIAIDDLEAGAARVVQ
jgi:hypothetical protein